MASYTNNLNLTKPGIGSTDWGQAMNQNLDDIDSDIQSNTDLAHAQLHDIDSATDHNGVSGATEDNFISFDDNGLPQDSGFSAADFGAAGAHASSHIHAGSDEIDGDKLDIDFTPDYYTPATVAGVADNVDDLSAHLQGIDTVLANSHSRQHGIDNTSDHTGVVGATEGNLISFDENGLPQDSGIASTGVPSATRTEFKNFVIDGGGSEIGTGIKGDMVVPEGTITAVTILADPTGSIVIDLWKCAYSSFDDSTHPVDGDSITASAPPTISGAVKSHDGTLTGWTTSITSGDIIRVNVDSCTSITRCTLVLEIEVSD